MAALPQWVLLTLAQVEADTAAARIEAERALLSRVIHALIDA